jgi:hypothetical protein
MLNRRDVKNINRSMLKGQSIVFCYDIKVCKNGTIVLTPHSRVPILIFNGNMQGYLNNCGRTGYSFSTIELIIEEL